MLRGVDIFQDLDDVHLARLAANARVQTVRAGEYVFLLGDAADRLYVVLAGKIDLCFPLSLGDAVTDISVESKSSGSSLGWSALVKPYRFTLSARAAEAAELASFMRQDMHKVFETDPVLGCTLMKRIAEVVGHRLNKVQALWVRSLQRELSNDLRTGTEERGEDR